MAYKYLIGQTLFEWAEYRFIFSALERGYSGDQIRSAMRSIFGRGIGNPVLSIARSYYVDGVLRAESIQRRIEGRGVQALLNTPLAMSPLEQSRNYLVQGYYHARVEGVDMRIGFSFNQNGFMQDDLERRASEIWDLISNDSLEDAILMNVVYEHININQRER